MANIQNKHFNAKQKVKINNINTTYFDKNVKIDSFCQSYFDIFV